jgi:hypothetical protein
MEWSHVANDRSLRTLLAAHDNGDETELMKSAGHIN